MVPLAVGAQLDDRQFVLEVVEDQQELVEDVADVGGIGIAVVELPDGDVLEIAHRVERRIAEEAAKLASVAVNAEFVQKFFQRVRRRTGFAEGLRNAPAVGVFQKRLAVVHADAGDGAKGDERKAVLTAVVVGTFEQRRLRIDISEFEVEADGVCRSPRSFLVAVVNRYMVSGVFRILQIAGDFRTVHIRKIGLHILVAAARDGQHHHVRGAELHPGQRTEGMGRFRGRE